MKTATRFAMTLDALDDETATFGPPGGPASLTMPRKEWERMNRPTYIINDVAPAERDLNLDWPG